MRAMVGFGVLVAGWVFGVAGAWGGEWLDMEKVEREAVCRAYWADFMMREWAPGERVRADMVKEAAGRRLLLRDAVAANSVNPEGAWALAEWLAENGEAEDRIRAIQLAMALEPTGGAKAVAEVRLAGFLLEHGERLAEDWVSGSLPAELGWLAGHALREASVTLKWMRPPPEHGVDAAERWLALCEEMDYERLRAEHEEEERRQSEERLRELREWSEREEAEWREEEERAAAEAAARGPVPAGSAAERCVRRGVEMGRLGRLEDAVALYRRAAELADADGEEGVGIGHEARALLAQALAFSGWLDEALEIAEEEAESESPWKEYMARLAAETAAGAGRRAEAVEWILDGVARNPRDRRWQGMVQERLRWFTDQDLQLYSWICGERLEALPPVAGAEKEIRELLHVRAAIARAFPELGEDPLAGDLARLRERIAAAEAAGEAPEAYGEGAVEEEREFYGDREGDRDSPGWRFLHGEPSWRSDPAVDPIERELNECLLESDPREALAAWIGKWGEEAAREVTVNGMGGLFWARSTIAEADWWGEKLEEEWVVALEEYRRQEGFVPRVLVGMLAGLWGFECAKERPDPQKLSSWADWAWRAAAGNRQAERQAALLALAQAGRQGNAAGVARFAGELGEGGDGDVLYVVPEEVVGMALLEGLGIREFVARSLEWEWLEPPLDCMTADELAALGRILARKRLVRVLWERPYWGDLTEDAAAEHLRLARLEESGNWLGEEGRRTVAASMARRPTARGALLAMRIHLADGDEAAAWRCWAEGLACADDVTGSGLTWGLAIERMAAALADTGGPRDGESREVVLEAIEKGSWPRWAYFPPGLAERVRRAFAAAGEEYGAAVERWWEAAEEGEEECDF